VSIIAMVSGVLFLIPIIGMLLGVIGECFAGGNDQVAVSVVVDDPAPTVHHHYVEKIVYKEAKKKAMFRQITCRSCGARQTVGEKNCTYCESAI